MRPRGGRRYGLLPVKISGNRGYKGDKAKGIVAKPMPKAWHDFHSVLEIEDEKTREMYLSILADKKPYFMRYIYPDLMRQYNTYIKTANKKAQREFSKSVEELQDKPEEELTDREREFLHYYAKMMPVGMSNCVINQVCRRFENAFDGYIRNRRAETEFDYTIMKSGATYTRSQYYAILHLFNDYNKRLQAYAVRARQKKMDKYDEMSHLAARQDEFRSACDAVCSNAKCLCDIMLDICYRRTNTKHFVWQMCGKEIIENLLDKNKNVISYPVQKQDGGVTFCGRRFIFLEKEIEATE